MSNFLQDGPQNGNQLTSELFSLKPRRDTHNGNIPPKLEEPSNSLRWRAPRERHQHRQEEQVGVNDVNMLLVRLRHIMAAPKRVQ
jgi:hypothetical protein